MKRLCWHFDFHSPAVVRIGERPDTEGMARLLADNGIEEIITFAKCHTGFTYYPSTLPEATVHPRLKGDPFGDVVNACQRHGIRVLAYVSFGVDGEAGRRHPEWAKVNANGVRSYSPDHFIEVCPYTTYLEALMLPQIEEICERYRPDGFFFDTMGALAPCYCEACRAAYRAAFGGEIPVRAEDPAMATYGAYRREKGLKLIARIGDFIQQRLPGAKVGFNQIGSLPYPEAMPPGISTLTLDFPTRGYQSLQASLNAKFGATSPLPADVMPTIFNQGWGDWSLSSHSLNEQVAVAIWANGACPYMGDRLHPENRLDARSVIAIRAMGALQRRVQAAFPPDSARLQPDILLLHGPGLVYGEDLRYFAIDPRRRLETLDGAHHLLLDCGENFGVVAEYALENWMDTPQLILCPEMPSLEASTAATLERFVRRGGTLLLVGRLPRVAGCPTSLAGVTLEENAWQDHIYLPALEGVSDGLAVLVRGDVFRLHLQEAEPVLHAIEPYDLRKGIRFGWGIGPAKEEESDQPIVTMRRLGAGRVYYLAVPLFSDYVQGHNWQQVEWFRAFLQRLLPMPRARVLSPGGGVEVVHYEAADGNTSWAVLVNHLGETLSHGSTPWARLAGGAVRVPVRLELAIPKGRRPASVKADGRDVRHQVADDRLTLEFELDALWRVLQVEWTT